MQSPSSDDDDDVMEGSINSVKFVQLSNVDCMSPVITCVIHHSFWVLCLN